MALVSCPMIMALTTISWCYTIVIDVPIVSNPYFAELVSARAYHIHCVFERGAGYGGAGQQ